MRYARVLVLTASAIGCAASPAPSSSSPHATASAATSPSAAGSGEASTSSTQTTTVRTSFVLLRIEFAEGSDAVVPDDYRVLHDADVLKAHPEMVTISVEAHAATNEPNGVSLSERRAGNVVRALTQLGVDSRRLIPVAAGSACDPRPIVGFWVLATNDGPVPSDVCFARDAGTP